MEWLGSVGMGAVWGWLAGMAAKRTRLSWPLVSCLAGATLIALAEVVWSLGWRASYWFLGAALVTLFAYLYWMSRLRRRAKAD